MARWLVQLSQGAAPLTCENVGMVSPHGDNRVNDNRAMSLSSMGECRCRQAVCQYASGDYRRELDQRDVICSMSRKANCRDNAATLRSSSRSRVATPRRFPPRRFPPRRFPRSSLPSHFDDGGAWGRTTGDPAARRASQLRHHTGLQRARGDGAPWVWRAVPLLARCAGASCGRESHARIARTDNDEKFIK